MENKLKLWHVYNFFRINFFPVTQTHTRTEIYAGNYLARTQLA